MGATPYRKDFYAKMVGGEGKVGEGEMAKLEAERRRWLEALERRLVVLKGFMASKEAKW